MKSILEYLELNAERYPEKTAIIDEFSFISYKELLNLSRRIGSGLADIIEKGAPIAVFMEKSINTLGSFFGITYAGGFYVQLNPELPNFRLKQIQDVLTASYVITDYQNKDRAEELFPIDSILFVEDLKEVKINNPLLNDIYQKTIDTNPLYANFTSGSTGVPKGVVVSHRSVIDFIDVFTELFDINYNDIIANQAPFDFDVSVKDIYSAIKTGATLVIIPRYLFSRPMELLDYICNHNITTMIWAVSALCLLSTFHGLDYKVPDKVNKVLFSGEVMPQKHLRTWLNHLPNAKFINLYGPTEITCNCTYHRIDRKKNYENGIPIGKAFPNEHVFLLDKNSKEIIESDEVGEICVRGTALALGYYRAKEQTNTVFVQNPLNDLYPELIYRTGDLGKYNENDEIIFCGRIDFQIKHMGHRIELEEIELAMSEIPGVERCCCAFDEVKSKLYGFYVGTIEKKELHQFLRKRLPIFMTPRIINKIEVMPMTKNGKIDRKTLLSSKENLK